MSNDVTNGPWATTAELTKTEPVEIDFSSMSEGIGVDVRKPFNYTKHYDALYQAIFGMTKEFKSRGYESFDFNDLRWDGSFYVGSVAKAKAVEPDPLAGLQYAGVNIKNLSARALALALNRKGWEGDKLPLNATLPPALLAAGQHWRIQFAYDEDGDTNVWVHNGTEWVGAYYTEGSWTEWESGPFSLSKTPPVEQVVTEDYLRQFEPKAGA